MHKDINCEFEWTATMINLNHGKNDELLAKCKVLADYMTLINKIRMYKRESASIKDAVDRSVNECIQEGVLTEFLKKHRGEVMSNCLTEFNEEVYRKGLLEEGREEGREEERLEAIHILIESLRELNQQDDVIRKKLMEKYALSEDEAEKWLVEKL